MPNEITAALIGVGGTLVGALAGAWLGGSISRRASRDLLQQQAKADFYAAFSETLSDLYLGHDQEHGFACDLLNKHFYRHYAAYQKLHAILSKSEQTKLNRRWEEYAGDAQYELPEERDMYRFCDLLDKPTTHEQNMAAIEHVKRLLGEA